MQADNSILDTPLMKLSHVGVNYNSDLFRRKKHDFWALKDISLTLHKGDSLGVIGRNGMGKSTLLRLMAGILRPDTGKFILQKNTKACLLSLQAGFIPNLSGRENVFMSGLLLGMRYRQIEALYPYIVALAEIEHAMEKPVCTYSDGMKARLGFAISYQMDPDILLIDEVLGVGDAPFREKSAQMMKERIRSDRTVVLVSHNPNTIRELCTRAVWIEEGVTRAQGHVEDVMKHYEAHLSVLKGHKGAGGK